MRDELSFTDPAAPNPAAPREKTRGEVYEGIAFTFCKAATIVLFTGPFALPIASGAAAVFYILAHRAGKNDTRCILKKPLLIAVFWGTISVVSLAVILRVIPIPAISPQLWFKR